MVARKKKTQNNKTKKAPMKKTLGKKKPTEQPAATARTLARDFSPEPAAFTHPALNTPLMPYKCMVFVQEAKRQFFVYLDVLLYPKGDMIQ